MKAMILAAGLGTRLRPLTLRRPKALVPVANRPVIDLVITYLKAQGVTEIVVNAHHHSDQIVTHLERGRPFGLPVEVRVEPDILGTGGGIRNTADFWDDAPFVVINGDTLTDLDLSEPYRTHIQNKSLATLVLHRCEPFSQIRVDQSMNITEISPEHRPGWLAFTGIHILEPQILREIPQGKFFNILDCYRDLMGRSKGPRAYLADGHRWRDVGSVESYIRANREALKGERFLFAPHCRVDASARIGDWAIVGPGSVLEKDAEVRRSILWDHVRVGTGVRVIDAVVTSHQEVHADLIGGIL